MTTPYKPWFVVTYNKTTDKVAALDSFEQHEHAQKWIDFLILNSIGVYSLIFGVYTYEKDEEVFTMQVKHQ